MKVIYLMILIVIGLNNNVHSQQLTFSNLTQILDFKNEFDLNEYLDTKKFIFIEERSSDTTSNIKVYGYASVSKNEAEEAIILYYDLSNKLAKVDYMFGGLEKNNKFKSSYTPNNLVRRLAWSSNNINNAVFCNSKYTMYYKSFKNELHLNANTYIYELVKRYGIFDRIDGYIRVYHDLGVEKYFGFNYFKNLKLVSMIDSSVYKDQGYILVVKKDFNDFNDLDFTYKKYDLDKKMFHIHTEKFSSNFKLDRNVLLQEKVCFGKFKGEILGFGNLNIDEGKGLYKRNYVFDTLVNDYKKVDLIIEFSRELGFELINVDDNTKRYEIMESDEIVSLIKGLNEDYFPHGKCYYEDDEIIIEGEYDYGLKKGLWIYKKDDKIIKTLNYKNGELVEE